VEPAERLTDARPGLITKDRAEQEACPGYPADLRRGSKHCRLNQRVAMQRGERMVVIEFEALDEARVEHRRGHRAGSEITPADQLAGPRGVESRDGLDPLARPGELSTHETAGHAVEHEVLRAITDTLGNVVDGHLGNPGSKPAGRSIRVGRRPRTLSLLLGGAVCSGAHH